MDRVSRQAKVSPPRLSGSEQGGSAPRGPAGRAPSARWPEGGHGLGEPRILIIDDESTNIEMLSRILARAGIRAVTTTSDPRQALTLFRDTNPDLVLLDLHMPGKDGLSVLEELRGAIPEGTYLPILMLTGDGRSEARQRALSGGARDFLTKPFEISEVVLRIRNLLETRGLHLRLESHNRDLESLVTARTRQLEDAQIEVLERLAGAAEVRDDDTGQHTQRVATTASVLASAARMEESSVGLIRRAAPLHDVGKIGIPDAILLKPGRLTDEEFEVMKRHTTIGARILAGGRSDLMQMAERIALNHHERWDGTGYPRGIAAETIPLEARVVAVADFFDALTHARPYRQAWPLAKVTQEIAALAGRHFDPHLARVFLSLESLGQFRDAPVPTASP